MNKKKSNFLDILILFEKKTNRNAKAISTWSFSKILHCQLPILHIYPMLMLFLPCSHSPPPWAPQIAYVHPTPPLRGWTAARHWVELTRRPTASWPITPRRPGFQLQEIAGYEGILNRTNHHLLIKLLLKAWGMGFNGEGTLLDLNEKRCTITMIPWSSFDMLW